MMSTLGNNSNLEENLLLSLPAALAMSGNARLTDNENFMPITTQNYTEKYKDMENLLAEEKKTNEEFKKFYKILKTDHTRLKAESFDFRTQINNLIEENKIMQEKYKSMFEKMQQELRRKQLFIEELKNRELDEVKLERIKEELSQQIEAPYKDIVRQLEQELQKLQSECNNLRQETNILRSANEHDKLEHHNYLDQLKLKQEIELNALRKDRDLLRQKLQENNQSDAFKIKDVLRDNNQFKIKIKSLLEENEELREKVEHIESHNNALMRNHSKAISDYSTKISVLESEKESLKLQAENSYKETINLNESLADMVRKLHDAERENTSIKLKFDEVQHNCKRDIANLKLEWVKEKGEFNRTKEALNNQIDDLKLQIEIANSNVEAQKKILEEKERELCKAINGVNEENWSKITELTNDKIETESKIQILVKDFEFKISALQLEKDKSDDRLKSYEKQREEIVKENTRLRSLIVDSENLRLELEKEQEKNRELSRKCHKFETELTSNTSLEQELTELNMKLKNEVLFHTQEIQRLKDQIQRLREEYENRLVELKTQHISEKNDFNFKLEDLKSKLDRANTKISDAKKYHEKKKKQYQTYAKAIKMKAESLNAKVKELKLKEQAIGQMVPVQAYNKLKMHLTSITTRHQAFREMILNSGNFNQNALLINNNQQSSQAYFNKNFPTQSLDKQIYLDINENQDLFNDTLLNSIKDSFENKKENLLKLYKTEETSQKNDLNIKFDEISNRLDNLSSNQNEHLKTISTSSLDKYKLITTPNENKTNLESPVRTKTPESPKKIKETFKDTFESFNSELKPKEIQVKKLSLSSSSSSSSISEADSPRKSTKSLNESKSERFSFKKQETIENEEKQESIYEEEFADSSTSSDD